MLKIVRGLRYLHNKKIIHCDLATRNCLIGEDGLVRISDFGLSKALGKGPQFFLLRIVHL